jgi:hypothetical protein
MTPTPASRIARLEREARGLERDGHPQEAHVLRTTIYVIGVLLDPPVSSSP